jgi:hypothetical protein
MQCASRSLISTLCEGQLAELQAWTAELRLMEQIDCKADIEALYTLHGPATVTVCNAFMRTRCIVHPPSNCCCCRQFRAAALLQRFEDLTAGHVD